MYSSKTTKYGLKPAAWLGTGQCHAGQIHFEDPGSFAGGFHA